MANHGRSISAANYRNEPSTSTVSDDINAAHHRLSFRHISPHATLDPWAPPSDRKNRQFSTGSQYKMKHQFLLAIIAVSHFIFYGGLVFLIWQNFWFYQLIVIFMIRVLFVHFLFAFFMQMEKQFRSLPYVLLFDLLLPLYYLIFIPSILGWSKINKWK